MVYVMMERHHRELRTFGEIAVVTNTNGMFGKLENRGNNHPNGTYRFMNLSTRRIIISRDIPDGYRKLGVSIEI
jgi:hypothetical protein